MKLLNPGHKGTQVAEKGAGIGKGRSGKQGCRTRNGSSCSEIISGTERHRLKSVRPDATIAPAPGL